VKPALRRLPAQGWGEAEQQRVATAPLRGGHLRALRELAQRSVQRTPPRRPAGEGDRDVFSVVHEALAREFLSTEDVGLLSDGCGLGGRRRGISHALAIVCE